MNEQGGTSEGARRDVFRFEDPRQAGIHGRLLNLVGPGPASFYKDACRHMGIEDPMDTVTHQVGHCIRELEGALRDVLRPSVGVRSADPANGVSAENESERGGHKADVRAILAGLGVAEGDPVRAAWLGYAGGLHGRAHRSALNPPRPLDREFREFFEGMQGVLEEVLSRFEARFGSSFRLIDELLALESPTENDAKRLRDTVPNTLVAYTRFFEGIPDGRWLRPLRKKGLFARPTASDTDEDGLVRLLPWPPSHYLVRVAYLEPDLVKRIILELPETDNVRVHEDVASAARKMPPAVAAEVVPKATEGLDSAFYASALPRELAGVVAHLARGGREEDAVALARELLVLVPETTTPATDLGGGAVWPARVDAVPRFRPPEVYGEAVDACVRPLVDAAGEPAFAMLRDLLEEAIRISHGPHREEGGEELPYRDGLYVLRPAIEDSVYNDDRAPLGEVSVYRLLSAVRDAAERTAEADPSALARMVAALEERNNETFDRLALHLLRTFFETPSAPDLISVRLTGKMVGLSPGLFHEYARLLKERFPTLSPEKRGEVLRGIRQGPPNEELEEMRNYRASEYPSGDPPTEEELDAYVAGYAERWRLRLYRVLDDLLPAAEKAEYGRLSANHEDLSKEDPLFYGEPRARRILGRESPKNAEELAAMGTGDVLAFLRGFEPTDDWEGPDLRDVARELTGAVERDPARFAAEAGDFRGVDPTYVHALLWGLRKALRIGNDEPDDGAPETGSVFPWRSVLRLCLWVLDQPRRASEEQYARGRYVGWGPALQMAAELLRVGLIKPHELAFELREEVWAVLGRLAEDPDPTAEREESELDPSRPHATPHSVAINAVRGVALDAVVAYALWVRRNLEAGGANVYGPWRNLANAPEARYVLEQRLDPVAEPTRAVRSVYGYRLPHLVYLDRPWVESQLERIFPRASSQVHLGDAAWGAYLVHCAPDVASFEVLRDEYARAVERLDSSKPGGPRPDPDASLAEHLMVLHRSGLLDPEDPNGILIRFFENASDELRAHAVGFEGRRLRSREAPLPDAERVGLQDLWERRLRSAAASSRPSAAELEAFGWWFASCKFDEHYALERLDEALALGADVGRSHAVVKCLAEAAPRHPALAVACLDRIVRALLAAGSKGRWAVVGIEGYALTVLLAGLNAGDETAKRKSREMANVLVSNGHSRFEPLISIP